MWMLKLYDKIFRRSHQMCSVKKAVLKPFVKFIGKHLRQILFLNKVVGLSLQLIKKETLSQVSSCEFCENFKNDYLMEHLRATAFENISL